MAAKEDRRGRAIVTFARSWQALAAVRSLGARGIEVVTGDEIGLTPGSLSKYTVDSFVYPSADAEPEGFLAALDEAVERFRPPAGVPYVLLPVHRETYAIARSRRRFESRIAMALPPSEAMERVRDKGRLVEVARANGIETPRTWTPRSVAELAELLDEIEPPAFVKQRTGVGGVGIQRAETADEVLAAFTRLAEEAEPGGEPPIVQQIAAGQDYCVSALFDSGKALAVLTYRNLRSLGASAPGAVRQTVAAPAAEAAAIGLLEALDWHGIAEIDFIWSGREEDDAYLIEVNPRMFSGLFQAIASNVDYPWMLFQLALGQPVEPPAKVELDVTTETPVLGFLATLREAVASSDHESNLERAWQEAKEHLAAGTLGAGIDRLLAGLREGLAFEERLAAVRRLLEEREATLSELFAGDDPKAAIGLLYPLAIFLRRGRITPGAVVGAEPVDREEDSGAA